MSFHLIYFTMLPLDQDNHLLGTVMLPSSRSEYHFIFSSEPLFSLERALMGLRLRLFWETGLDIRRPRPRPPLRQRTTPSELVYATAARHNQ